MLEIGSLIDGKYRILSRVGQGGMSVVYMAINEKANKTWAVKEVRKDGVLDFEAVKQGLVAETDILKRLNHPNLPSIIDVIDTDESFIIIMDYIEGNSLSKALEEFGAQPQDYVVEWAKQLCDVLEYLHTRQPAIIYRDMKPSNIMLKPDGNVTLIDFGTAREYKEKNIADTTCLGTVGYAAPEQFGGMGQTDARTDVYCLGATLYHLVTGKSPCVEPYEIRPIREINPTLSSGLEHIIMKATMRNPAERYQSAAEMLYALEHYEEIDDEYRSKQKRKLGLFIATGVLTIVCAGVSVWGYTSSQSKKSAEYDNILLSAKTERDYYKAIGTDPTKKEAYIKLVEYLLSTDANNLETLTTDEHAILNALKVSVDYEKSDGYAETINNPLDQLRASSQKDYEDVCYEIGMAYVFYYDEKIGEKDRYNEAKYWFEQSLENHSDAQIYIDISNCFNTISTNTKRMSVSNEDYTNLWNKIKELNSNANNYNSDRKILIWKQIATLINNNFKVNEYGFYNVINKDEISSLLEKIKSDSSQIKNDVSNESFQELETMINQTIDKVNSNIK